LLSSARSISLPRASCLCMLSRPKPPYPSARAGEFDGQGDEPHWARWKAMKGWDEIWKTEQGRARWIEPESFVIRLLPTFKGEGLEKVLDLGFGLGRHSILLAKEGFEVYGIDSSPAGLQFARQWAEREGVALGLALADISQLPYASDSFDLILAWNVIYHGTVEYIQSTVADMERCLRPGGYLLCSLISTRHDRYGLGQEIENRTYVLREHEEKGLPHHYFDRAEAETLLGGFTLLTCEHAAGRRPGSYYWQILARLDGEEPEAR
jgi:tellurite methyltransferase